MPAGHFVGITIPFSVEELQHLTELALAHGGSIPDFIRARLFGSEDVMGEPSIAYEEDLTTLIARLEGIRIRARRHDWPRATATQPPAGAHRLEHQPPPAGKGPVERSW
jgi:hypothetical protein